MNLLLNVFRNGLGAIIAFISWLIPVKKIKRDYEKQKEIDKQTTNFELYQFFGCPFCIKTRRAIRRLNLKIITRDARSKSSIFREQLIQHTGKIQVPCLKITDKSEIKWMFEADCIISYLEKKFS